MVKKRPDKGTVVLALKGLGPFFQWCDATLSDKDLSCQQKRAASKGCARRLRLCMALVREVHTWHLAPSLCYI